MCPSYNAWKAQSQYPQKKIGQHYKGDILKKRPWLYHVGLKASLMLTNTSSPSDKAHFPFVSLYHKHKPGGKPGLEAVEARPWVLIYLMIYRKFPLLSERSSSNRKNVEGTWGICLFKLKQTALIPAYILLTLRPNYGSRQHRSQSPESKTLSALHSFATPSSDGNT